MLISIHKDNPDRRKIDLIASALREGAIIIYPTDTIYGIGCDIHNSKAFERICQIKNIRPKDAQFSFICQDIRDISKYTKGINTPTFRILKDILPGPYTCIFESSKEVPKILKAKKDTVGIRVPDFPICQDIIAALGNPIISTSLPMEADVEYWTDPELIEDHFGHLVDYVIDGGIGQLEASTVIDFIQNPPQLIRKGLGSWEE